MASGLKTIDGETSVPVVADAADDELVSYPSLLRRTQSLREARTSLAPLNEPTVDVGEVKMLLKADESRF